MEVHCEGGQGLPRAVMPRKKNKKLMSMGETTSLNCGHQRAYYPSPRRYTSMEGSSGMI
jgi:hypothetical protein